MNMTDPQIVAPLGAAILTVLAGLLGFFIRHYLTTRRPFISIIRIDGDTYTGAENLDIPDQVVEATKKTTFYTPLTSDSTLSTVRRTHDEFERIITHAESLLSITQSILVALENEEAGTFDSLLSQLFEKNQYDLWLTPMIGEHIEIEAADTSDEPRIPIHFEPQLRNGCYSIGLKGNSSIFGQELNRFYTYKHNIEKFLGLIQIHDYHNLAKVFTEIDKNIRDARKNAKEINPILSKLINNKAHWNFRLYCANLSKIPFLISPGSTLIVKDETGAIFEEACIMVTLEKNKSSYSRTLSSSPLVVKAESDVIFEFTTKIAQGGMKRGTAFREVFESGCAKCSIQLKAETVGFKKAKSYLTSRAKFVESD